MYVPLSAVRSDPFRPKQRRHSKRMRNLVSFLLHFEKAAKSSLEISCSHSSSFFNKEPSSSSGGLAASSLGSSSASSPVGSPENSRVDVASAALRTSSSA